MNEVTSWASQAQAQLEESAPERTVADADVGESTEELPTEEEQLPPAEEQQPSSPAPRAAESDAAESSASPRRGGHSPGRANGGPKKPRQVLRKTKTVVTSVVKSRPGEEEEHEHQLRAGAKVVVHGLVASRKHNGARAEIVRPASVGSRYVVRLSDGTELSLKHCNLRLAVDRSRPTPRKAVAKKRPRVRLPVPSPAKPASPAASPAAKPAAAKKPAPAPKSAAKPKAKPKASSKPKAAAKVAPQPPMARSRRRVIQAPLPWWTAAGNAAQSARLASQRA